MTTTASPRRSCCCGPTPLSTQARETTRGVGGEAVALLAPLPESEAKAALTALVTSVVDRVG